MVKIVSTNITSPIGATTEQNYQAYIHDVSALACYGSDKPYVVSSLLVPPDVAADTDGVAYMVRVFKLRNPHAPGGDFGDVAYQGQAMKFLLENDVRQKASQKLQSEIAELLKREVI